MVILPTGDIVGITTTTRITFFNKIIKKLQQQAKHEEQRVQQEQEEGEEARQAWEKLQEPVRKLQEARKRLKEEARRTMETNIPRKGIKLVPCLPLVDQEVVDVDKTFLLNFKLKIRPNGGNDNTYEKAVRRFSDGTPSTWIQTLHDIHEVWTQNRVGGASDRMALVKTILQDDALTVFMASIESQTEVVEGQEAAATQLTNEKVELALKAVTSSVFPHRALETQKLWMRRHMKKPAGMSYRLMQAKVLKMNKSLPLFPDATMESKFTSAELLELLEFSLPASWRAKFDLDGYVPTKHDRARLLTECEAIERNEKIDNNVVKPKGTTKRKEAERKPSASRRMPRNPKLKFCSEHGPNTTHDSSKCWVLHPNLKPSKFAQEEKFNGKGKAMKVLLKNTSKSELLQMVLSSQQATAKSKERTSSGTKGSKKRTKVEKPSESSDESVQQMDCDSSVASGSEETPPPSDDEIIPKSSKKKQKRIRQLGQADE